MSRWLKACTATPCADQLRDDVGLQVGERQHQVGLEREDLRHVGGDERRHPRLLAPHLRRPHRIAGHADDAAVLAEEIERLHGFFGQADDSLGREHGRSISRLDALSSASSSSSPPAASTRPSSIRTTCEARRRDLAGLMADIDHRHLGLVAQPREIRQDFELARAVERGERLVEQQEPRAASAARGRPRRAGARRRTACPAAASSRWPMSSSATMRSRSAASAASAAHPAAVVEILRHREMREQPAFLEHVADAAAVRRHVDARCAVEQHGVVERDAAAVRRDQAGDHVDDRGLAGARRAEQRGDAARGSRTAPSSANSPSRFSTSTTSISVSVIAHAGAPREPFGRDQRGERDDDRDDDQPASPRRRRPAPGSACRSRPRWSASRRGCWRRR